MAKTIVKDILKKCNVYKLFIIDCHLFTFFMFVNLKKIQFFNVIDTFASIARTAINVTRTPIGFLIHSSSETGLHHAQ